MLSLIDLDNEIMVGLLMILIILFYDPLRLEECKPIAANLLRVTFRITNKSCCTPVCICIMSLSLVPVLSLLDVDSSTSFGFTSVDLVLVADGLPGLYTGMY